MAEIVKACDTSLPSRPLVAVKRILPHLCDDAQYRTMFLDESRVLAQLDHPNIIHAFEIGEVDGTPYIAMDYVDGQDARTLFHRAFGPEQQLPLAIACHIIANVCDGLHHAHEQRDPEGELLGLVHRDVSLQNVLLSYAGDVKITDFGIAVSSQNEARTEVGIVKGKFGYMSPEQIRGAPLDRRSDVFGAGICLYELLTGERLFIGDNDYKAIERVRNVTIDPPSKLNRNIPSDLEHIVLKALAKQPRDRHPTALDLRRELMAFMAAAGERCTRDDLGAYLRTVFASEYESEDESATAIGENPELEAARAALPLPAGAVASDSVLDGTTGLAAFDHLDPISTVSFAVDPEASSYVRLPPVNALPSLRGAHTGTLPPPGLQAVVANPEPVSSPSLRTAPEVPPVVPRPGSIPGTVQAAELLGGNDNGVPEPRPLAMDWDEHEPTTVSKGLPPVTPTPAAETFDPEEEVTRVRQDELPDFTSAHRSGPFPPLLEQTPSSLAATSGDVPSGWQGTTSRPPVNVSSFPAAASFRRPRFDLNLTTKVIAGVVGALVLIAASLYWSHARAAATIRLTTDPRDAIVVVDGERAAGNASPFVLSDLDAAEEHAVSVDKPGYQGWSTRLKLRPDQVLDLPLIKLEPDVAPLTAAGAAPLAPPPLVSPASSPPVAAEPSSPPAVEKKKTRAARSGSSARESKPESVRAARATPSEPREKHVAKPSSTKPASEKPAAAAAQSGGTGTLRVNSRPWSRVVVDGRLIGNTPQMAIPLRPGKHTVTLVNPEFGVDKTLTVEIKAGEVVTKAVVLQ
jgi:serine/threonine protein kinase